MTTDQIISSIPFKRVYKVFLDFFERQFGEVVVQDLFLKVKTSSKINKFLVECEANRVRPGTQDYLLVTISSRYFSFSPAEKAAFASTLLLSNWNDDIGLPYGVSDDYYLNSVFFSLLNKCSNFKRGSNTPNFFERFYTALETFSFIPMNKFPSLPNPMPSDLSKSLNGYTINEALERAIIDDLGDSDGNFVFDCVIENMKVEYAVIQGYSVYLSSALSMSIHRDDSILGDLMFSLQEGDIVLLLPA